MAAMGASQTVTTFYSGTTPAASGDTYFTFPMTLEYAMAVPAQYPARKFGPF
jgi:hypothetical protein